MPCAGSVQPYHSMASRNHSSRSHLRLRSTTRALTSFWLAARMATEHGSRARRNAKARLSLAILILIRSVCLLRRKLAVPLRLQRVCPPLPRPLLPRNHRLKQGGCSRREQDTFEGLAYCNILPHRVFDQLGGMDHPFCAAPLASRGRWILAVFSGGARPARLGSRDHSRRTRTRWLASILLPGLPPGTISMDYYRDFRAADHVSNT